MGRAWWATVHVTAKSQTWLSDWHLLTYIFIISMVFLKSELLWFSSCMPWVWSSPSYSRISINICSMTEWMHHYLVSSLFRKGVCMCLTPCDPMGCNPPGSSVHGILQARILDWVPIPFSRGTSQPRAQTCVFCSAGGFCTVWATRKAQDMWINNT